MLKRLEQITIEDKYSRKNIKDIVLKQLEESIPELREQIISANRSLMEYLRTTYSYASKNNRICEINNLILVSELVPKILVETVQFKGVQTIQTVVGKLEHLMPHDDQIHRLTSMAEILTVMSEGDMWDIIPAKYSETGSIMFENKLELDEATLQRLADTKYLPPMICEPHVIENNSDSAYLTIGNDSIILGKGNHHNGPLALDVINIMNQQELCLDTDMLCYEEQSKKPLDTHEKKENFKRISQSSEKVYSDLLQAGNQFHVTHKYDKRGRIYTQGYHVHIQSTSYKKALINLTTKELIKCE
jgi:hypothetical protein